LLETAYVLKKELDAHVIFSRAGNLPETVFNKFQNELTEFELSGDESYKLIMNSDAVLSKAGTSTVECCLFEVPCLIFYKTNILNYRLLKPFVKVNNLGMVNILAKKNIVKEFIQKDFTKEKLSEEIMKLLKDESYREQMINEFRKIRKILGEKDSAENASQIILKELKLQ
jgi:lipid-A-disaccharide synthase